VPGDPASVPQAALGQVLISQGAGVASVMSANPAVSGSLAVGTNPAQSGVIRLANGEAVRARNGANTGDVEIVAVSSGNEVRYGSLSVPALAFHTAGEVTISVGAGTNYAIAANYIAPWTDNARDLGVGSSRFKTLHLGTAINLKETAVPAAPEANTASLWLQDNGAGKSQLMVRFATGAAIQLAIEP